MRNILTRFKAKHLILNIFFLIIISLLSGCATKNNTKFNRFYQALTTRYNVYFNGNEAYKNGNRAIEQGNKDNYMEMIPFYPIGNKTTVGVGKNDFDRAIEKSQKAVTLHSIKKKPVRKPGKRYSDAYKKWLARKEFNPFLHNAWLLMGKAQFQKGDFPAAAATFSYIIRLYDGQPKITTEARIWLARCYTQQEWYYDAEDVLQKVNNDSLPAKLIPEYNTAYTQYLVGSQRFRESIPFLQATIKNEKNKKQKARQYFLLGQIYQSLDEPQNAYIAYGKVISQNPIYELELNARIRQTEVTSQQNPSSFKKVVKTLEKMSKADKNADYLDQIYYALGNVYLANQDTLKAIKQYTKGVELSTRNGVEKGIIQLTLGNLYWQLEKFEDAQKAYADAIGLIDKNHDSYKEINHRSTILDELVPHTNAIELQDSLQHLASLDSISRMIVIDTLIARFIQKENEELEAQRALEKQMMKDEVMADNIANARPGTPTQKPIMPSNDKSWYFYNTQTVTQGKSEFQRLWGKRKLEDDWRRKNKTVVALDDFEEVNYDEENENGESTFDDSADNLNEDMNTDDTDQEIIDEKHPQFYLQQIPLTKEGMEASNEILSEALYNAGMIFKDKLENYRLAEKAFNRILTNYPDLENIDVVYYNYYLMLGFLNRMAEANMIKATFIELYPDNKYALTLADPNFEYNAIYGKQIEDSLYVATYQAFQSGNLQRVLSNTEISATKYPMGKHRPKFLFLEAMSHLQNGNSKLFLEELKKLVQTYQENEISDIAAHILKGVQEGRLLESGNLSLGNIWNRRNSDLLGNTTEGNETDEDRNFSAEKQTPYLFILAYEDGKVDENILLYEMARYNFSSFIVKNFDLSFGHDQGIGRLIVKEFSNMDEALYYQRQLYADPYMNEKLSGIRSIIISESNYELLNKYYSFDDYDTFYNETFKEANPNNIKDEEIIIDGSTLDDPILNLPETKEENLEETEDEGEEIEEGNGIYYIY